jgi:hypothetical protein
MKQIQFIIDESGAKGYSDNTEAVPGELGVMAGFLIPEEFVATVQAELGTISSKFRSQTKLHVTDLVLQDQEALRSAIFDYFRVRGIPWVYEGIYVQGFHEHMQLVNGIATEAMGSRRSRIKLSYTQKAKLLHAELFVGAFGKGIAFAMDCVGNEFQLNIVTDRVDRELMKLFRTKADRLLNAEQPLSRKVTGFDPDTQKVVRGEIRTTLVSGHEALGDLSGVNYSIRCADSSLTLAADVLANSVYHHLRTKQSGVVGTALNAEAAVMGHPLADLVYGAWNAPEGNYFSDALFMHPESVSKLGDGRT